MAKGLDTMVQDNPREEVTVSDGLQLGRSIADQTDPKDGENEGTDLATEVCVSVTIETLSYISYISTCETEVHVQAKTVHGVGPSTYWVIRYNHIAIQFGLSKAVLYMCRHTDS